MGIEFRRTLKEYSPPFQEILDEYFPEGKIFNSLNEALSQEYKPGKTLKELFEVGQVSRSVIPENLPAELEEITEADILWRQYADEKHRIEFHGQPVLSAKYVP